LHNHLQLTLIISNGHKEILEMLTNQKRKKTRKISPTNIIYIGKIKVRQAVKIFKVEGNDKSQKKKMGKKFQNSSASICKIKQGFRRSGR